MSTERFISESIRPVADTFDTGRMATGEPGLPRCFTWRGQRYTVAAVTRTWREFSPCRRGSGELYLRKHFYEVRLTTGAVAKIYFERQARSTAEARKRWWLFSLTEGEPAGAGGAERVPQ